MLPRRFFEKYTEAARKQNFSPQSPQGPQGNHPIITTIFRVYKERFSKFPKLQAGAKEDKVGGKQGINNEKIREKFRLTGLSTLLSFISSNCPLTKFLPGL
jgi:hypothetical protein